MSQAPKEKPEKIINPNEPAKAYEAKLVEKKWYEEWKKRGYFKASVNSKKKPYTIVIPPPNVTGILHMGHALNKIGRASCRERVCQYV